MSESLVPPGKSLTDLTVAELSYVSRKVKADAIAVLGDDTPGGHPERVMVLAWLAVVWKRRQVGHEATDVKEFTALTFTELMGLLKTDQDPDDKTPPRSVTEEIEADPTDSTPA